MSNNKKKKELTFEEFLEVGYYKNLSIRNSKKIEDEKNITNQVACLKCIQIYSIDLIDKSCFVKEKKDMEISNSTNITVFCKYCNYDSLIPLSKLDGNNISEKIKKLNYISKLAFLNL